MQRTPRRFVALFLVSSLWIFSGCTVVTEFKAPLDEIFELCVGPKPELATPSDPTLVSCETITNKKLLPVNPGHAAALPAILGPDNIPIKEVATVTAPSGPVSALPALVVLIEPGTLEANRALMTHPVSLFRGSSFGPLLHPNNIPDELEPHVRTLMSNFVLAFLKYTFRTNSRKYNHVYFVKGDAQLKTVFMHTIQKAAALHSKVDLFLVGSAIPGSMLMTKDLIPGHLGNLSGEEIKFYADTHMGPTTSALRSRVRAVFATHGFMALAPSNPAGGFNLPIMMGFKRAFPQADVYGSTGVNIYPLHRDFVMFEHYYTNGNFALAMDMARKVMRETGSGALRTQIVIPPIMGKGCILVYGYKNRCAWEIQPAVLKLPVNNATYNVSQPLLPIGP